MASGEIKVDLEQELTELKQLFGQDNHPTYRQRRQLIEKIKKIILQNEQQIVEAISQDYGFRKPSDTYFLELIPTLSYMRYASKNIKKWMKKQRRHTGLYMSPSRVEVRYQPLGVVGIMVPWNTPVQLTFGPLVAAVAAGNKVMVKLSEFTPNTNRVLIESFASLKNHIRFYEGEVEVSSIFSTLAFDHLVFTGSTQVGRIVSKAAAENLTPVTLELGGKSPVIVGQKVNLENAVNNILQGKVLNSGQICVSPDYVFVHASMKQEFIEFFTEKVKELFGVDDPQEITRIISDSHFKRLNNYLGNAREKGANIIQPVKSSTPNQIFPTLLDNVSDDMLIMQEEIFGSLLPIMTYKKIDEAIDYINSRPRPLALYVMSKSSREADQIISRTHSGGVSVNDTIAHLGVDDAPFGGIGDSGSGHYHGVEGFLEFSKAKTVLRSSSLIPRAWLLLKYSDQLLAVFRRIFIR